MRGQPAGSRAISLARDFVDRRAKHLSSLHQSSIEAGYVCAKRCGKGCQILKGVQIPGVPHL
ncbi:hypothetical protein GKIL_3984 [Gloeobacter kilaueensis JS1]|uniref:Uncharacterized protein n=1 Tax=Gloeobacter kilaueensis (strain ATCC BAA-2537 / CCAP 1431/1 / ULC 316 / JS1) TaxID=1183438 RepID=U5QR82_GLOK1|nr:hypothetical protein GKIL_3984 [Gloeobacter kilaueensis JS1]